MRPLRAAFIIRAFHRAPPETPGVKQNHQNTELIADKATHYSTLKAIVAISGLSDSNRDTSSEYSLVQSVCLQSTSLAVTAK